MSERQLNEQQQLFLEVLFTPEIGGDVLLAKKAAGYSDNYPTTKLVKSLEDEILAATRAYMSRLGPRAAVSLGDVLVNPTQLGVRDKLAAAKDVLDRVGVVKVEKMDITGNGIFILPPKE